MLRSLWLYLLVDVAASLHVQRASSPFSSRRAAVATGLGLAAAQTLPAAAFATEDEAKPKFQGLSPIQFIAALSPDPKATSGTGAEKWGLWREDPGPRGVYLRDFDKRQLSSKPAPAGWTFDPNGWWVEEHGLIMPPPEFPLPARRFQRDGEKLTVTSNQKRYVVTGDREITSVLTVHDDGRWELSKGNLYDVTHLPCRSGLYTPPAGKPASACTPTSEAQKVFPVKPGAKMPPIGGCAVEDWAVLFVVGVEV